MCAVTYANPEKCVYLVLNQDQNDSSMENKPKNISPGIKTKPQHNSGLLKNSSENPVWTIPKQSRKVNPDCSKIVPKIQPGLSESSLENS